jgi:hypothetical protein
LGLVLGLISSLGLALRVLRFNGHRVLMGFDGEKVKNNGKNDEF